MDENALAVYAATTFAAATVLVPVQSRVAGRLSDYGATVSALGWAALVLMGGLAMAWELHRRGWFIRL
jgi:hypothetical protein